MGVTITWMERKLVQFHPLELSLCTSCCFCSSSNTLIRPNSLSPWTLEGFFFFRTYGQNGIGIIFHCTQEIYPWLWSDSASQEGARPRQTGWKERGTRRRASEASLISASWSAWLLCVDASPRKMPRWQKSRWDWPLHAAIGDTK